VLVLDGSSARIGDHATLLATSPLYRDLVGHWQADHRGGQASSPTSGPPARHRRAAHPTLLTRRCDG
jgi:hypothetical protein